ncbi:unnamed protein product [Ambrosiozyma monospora]|uniref:Unnamed protein product n=1 Tax=Ambrosiozyma monospora TaxID=43982 RepID=A0ACB5TC25_AMBMO|nr:unnamed protein product [Ambrosiozyma monospora]
MSATVVTKDQELQAPYFKLYSYNESPNGKKIKFLFKLLKVDYYLQNVDIPGHQENRESWFLKINPSGRIPVLEHVDENGNKKIVYESAAISYYLVNKLDKKSREISYDFDDPLYYEDFQWTVFTATTYDTARFQQLLQLIILPSYGVAQNERLVADLAVQLEKAYAVYETQLKNNGTGYLVGDKKTVSDIFSYAWIACLALPQFDAAKYPCLKAWCERLNAEIGPL